MSCVCCAVLWACSMLRAATACSSVRQVCWAWVQAAIWVAGTLAAAKRVVASSSAALTASRAAGRRAARVSSPPSMPTDRPRCTCICCTRRVSACAGTMPCASWRAWPMACSASRLVQQMQVHRGLSVGMLGGDETLAARRPAARDAVNAALDDATTRFAAAKVPATQMAAWTQAQQTRRTLEQAVAARSIEQAQSTAQHTQLIASLLQLNESLLHAYGLQIDPDADTHALIQASLVQAPMLGEKLGMLRAQGASALGKRELTPQGKGQLLVLQQRVAELQADTFRGLDRALQGNPDLQRALGSSAQAVQGQIQQSLQMAERDVINASELQLPSKDYFDAFTRTIEALNALNNLSMASLDQALQARVSDLQRGLLWVALALVVTL